MSWGKPVYRLWGKIVYPSVVLSAGTGRSYAPFSHLGKIPIFPPFLSLFTKKDLAGIAPSRSLFYAVQDEDFCLKQDDEACTAT